MAHINRDFKGIWIPKELWLSQELSLQEKVMLLEIDSLDNEEHCYASNAYFAEFFGLSKTRISTIINGLAERGYISVQMVYKPNSAEVEKRIISVIKFPKDCCGNSSGGILKTEGGILKTEGGYSEKFKDNNTVTNNTNKKDIAQNLFPVTKTKKESKAKDIVTMKAMINAFTESDDLQEKLSEYFSLRLKKGLQPNQWKIILDDLKTFTKGHIDLAVEKVNGAIAGGYLQIIPPWEKNRQQAFLKPSFDNTAGREVKSAKEEKEVLATDENGNLIKF